jgi:hypothetical protein
MAVTAPKHLITPQFTQLKQILADIEADVAKRDEKGNAAAGTRVRKAMQQVKKLAQGVRETVVLK